MSPSPKNASTLRRGPQHDLPRIRRTKGHKVNDDSNADRLRLIEYINAATDLAEGVQGDIKSDKKTYSNETIIKLSKFIASANRFRHILDLVDQVSEGNKNRLN